jgi:EAL domain-containing protein (putative c-di-GMP-specific phosphodiesterase class I)
VDLATGRIEGFEALLRWKHEGRGIQAPHLIASAFDDASLALAIGRRIRAHVAEDIRRWLAEAVTFKRIAINVSSAEFRHRDFATDWLNDLARMSVPPTCMEIEVTETVFLDRDTPRIRRAIDQLKEAGVSIALDDFGTGYASLAHLQQFPVDVLKIDRSFVQNLSKKPNKAIVCAIVGLARNLGMVTVAEGVETVSQADRLRAKGCDLAQGFLYSAAVPAHEVPHLACRIWPMTIPNDRRLEGDRPDRHPKVIGVAG